jgi:hypothetical protein
MPVQPGRSHVLPQHRPLVPRRVIPDSSVHFSRRQLPHAKVRQITLVALVDLRHRQVFLLHHIFPSFES